MTLQGMSLPHPEFKQQSHLEAHERMARDTATTDFVCEDGNKPKGLETLAPGGPFQPRSQGRSH